MTALTWLRSAATSWIIGSSEGARLGRRCGWTVALIAAAICAGSADKGKSRASEGGSRPLASGSLQPRQQAAQILALLEAGSSRRRSGRRRGRWRGRGRCRACRCRAGRRGRRCVARSASGMPRPSSSTSISTHSGVVLDGDEDPAAAIFGGILDQVAEHLVEILALDPDRRPSCRRRGRR